MVSTNRILRLKDILLVLSISVFMLSCQKKTNSEVDVIEINPLHAKESMNLSEIADSIKCVRLKNTSEKTMGMILEIVIKKNYIYAWDMSQKIIFVFNKEGNYISKLDKCGEGPQDYYLGIGSLFIDENEEFVEIKDYTALKKYKNISFEFVESTPFPKGIHCNTIKKTKDYYYCASDQFDNVVNGKKMNAELLVLDKDYNITPFFEKTIVTNNSYFGVNNECFAENEKNELFMSLLYDNKFYQLKDGAPFPILEIDFGKYAINKDVGLRTTEEQMNYMETSYGRVSYPLLCINNDDMLAFTYFYRERDENRWLDEKDIHQFLKLKKTGKEYHMKKIKNDMSEFPNYLYLSTCIFGCAHNKVHEGYLVDVVIPEDYFPDIDEEIYVEGLGKITAFDDPIVVFAKLKDFTK